jgi:hypothetical protein
MRLTLDGARSGLEQIAQSAQGGVTEGVVLSCALRPGCPIIEDNALKALPWSVVNFCSCHHHQPCRCMTWCNLTIPLHFFGPLRRSELFSNLDSSDSDSSSDSSDSSSVIDLFSRLALLRQLPHVCQEESDDELSVDSVPVSPENRSHSLSPNIASRSSASLSRNAASSLPGIGTAFNTVPRTNRSTTASAVCCLCVHYLHFLNLRIKNLCIHNQCVHYHRIKYHCFSFFIEQWRSLATFKFRRICLGYYQ